MPSRGSGAVAQKKSLLAAEREEEHKALWRKEARKVDPERFVFVDECGTHTSMRHLYARAPKGERAYAPVPRHRTKNTMLLARA